MKDNFDLKAFLIENKMTQASGSKRVHFGKTLLNENVRIDEMFGRDEDGNVDYSEYSDTAKNLYTDDDTIEEAKIDRDALYREYTSYAAKYGEEKAMKFMRKFYPDIDFDAVNIIPKYARKNAQACVNQEKARLNRMTTGQEFATRDDLRNPETGTAVVRPTSGDFNYEDEKGRHMTALVREYDEYEDDEDFVDDDFIGARGTNADLGIGTDPRAEKAARRGMKDTDLDADSVEEPEFNDFVEPEDVDDEAPEDVAPANDGIDTSDVDTSKALGKNAPYVEVLVDDLARYLKGPRGNWRVNVSTVILRRAIDAAKEYLDEFEYPRKGILYLIPNKVGYYDMETRDIDDKAVVAVHRDPIN